MYILYGECEKMRSATEGIYRRYPKCVCDVLMNFLGTHDTKRILTVFGGDSGDGRTADELAHMKLIRITNIIGQMLVKNPQFSIRIIHIRIRFNHCIISTAKE